MRRMVGADGFAGNTWISQLYRCHRVFLGDFLSTTRSTCSIKNDHLRALEGAGERLILCKADLLDFNALRAAINGCDGVFHTASPLIDDPELMVEPAVRGTKYVHVHDVAEAHIRVFEDPEANGRYLCAESVLHRGDVQILAKLFPQYHIPTKIAYTER